MKNISILLCAYNSELVIGDAIESILNQTYHDFELIIVDDGSSDNTLDVIHSFHDERIIAIEATHDYINSLNLGMNRCQGELIARIDADDIMEPTRIAEQVRLMRTNLDMTVCFSWATTFGENTGLCGSHVQGWIPIPYFWLLTGNFLLHPTAIIHKEFLERHKILYREYPYAEDYKLWAEMAQYGASFYVYPHTLIQHRCHDKQVSKIFADIQWQTRLRIQQEIIEGLLPHVVSPLRRCVNDYYQSMVEMNKKNLMQGDNIVWQMYTLFDRLRKSGDIIL